MKRLLLSWLMVLLVVLSIMPVMASAESTADGSQAELEEWLGYLATHPVKPSSQVVPKTSNIVSVDGDLARGASKSKATADNLRRYTVLVLDRSGSMSSTPMKALKTAASKFCETVLKAQGENYVAIVAYGPSATTLCDFTSDVAKLQTAINKITSSGGTNTTQGLEYADKLLSSIDNASGTIKNILLLSDGLPGSGTKLASGKYEYSDYSSYQYANATYATAVSLKEKKYNIYTLGFFHAITNAQLNFARRFMQDLQNAGYYDVVDPNALEFEFGQIAGDITDENNYPIIIIPGVMGSRLFLNSNFDDSSALAWPPSGSIPEKLYTLVGMGEILKNWDLWVRTFEDQRKVEVSKREYGSERSYEEIVERLLTTFPNRAIYVFSYDWRKDNKASADKLKSAIDALKDEQGKQVKKVDLVCHSMGGLVASSYYSQYKTSHKINKIITAGTPYEGAPKLINAVQNWDILADSTPSNTGWLKKMGNSFSDLLIGLSGMTKDVKSSFLSIAELAPTRNYVSVTPMWKDSWIPFSIGDYSLTYDQYVSQCNKVFGQGNFSTATSFHNSLLSSGYNALLEFPNSYFAIGVDQPTIAAITFQFTSVDVDPSMKYDNNPDAKYTMKGDATVPYLSASIMEKVTKLPSHRYRTFSTDHGGTIGHRNKDLPAVNAGADESLDWIVKILNNEVPAAGSSTPDSRGYVVIRVACPIDVNIRKGSDYLSYSSNEVKTAATFGRMDVLGLHDEVKMFFLYDDGNYDITLRGTDNGTMDYTIRRFTANDVLIDERTANDIPVTKDTVIKTSTDFDDVPNPTRIRGDNQLTVLPGSSFPLAFAVDVQGNDKNTQALKIEVDGKTASVDFTGNGTCIIPCEASFAAVGDYPITASVPGLDAVNVGTVTVVDVTKYLQGNLETRLGSSYLYGQAAPNIPVAFKSASGELDGSTGILAAQGKDVLTIGICYAGSGSLSGRLVKMRDNPFAATGKAVQVLPNDVAAKAIVKRDTSKKVATLAFSSRSLSKLEPGYYQFEVQSAKTDKHKGFPYLTLATIHLVESESEEVLWSMPTTLRASIGQQYQLVTPIIDGDILPALRVSSSDTKIATINSAGLMTAIKSGNVTLSIRSATGSIMKCAVTVGSNSVNRARPLMTSSKAGLYSSTRRLYYNGSSLNADVFLYNRTSATINELDNVTFDLYDGEALMFSAPMQSITFQPAIMSKQYKTLRFTITDAMIPGIAEKNLDLGIGRYSAVIHGIDDNGRQVVILKSNTIGTVMAKTSEIKSTGAQQLQMQITE